MAEEDLHIVELRDYFYRDRFGKVILIMLSLCVAIGLLIATAVYLYLNKPKPVTFHVDNDWRIQADVPLDQPYLSSPDLIQWVSDVVRRMFIVDFINYDNQVKNMSQYFTPDGWRVFLDQLNIYANYTNVQTNKLFVNDTPDGAPIILQQGLLSGRYGWWVQMPVNVNFATYNRTSSLTLTLQILVVRVSTLKNLAGVGIDNVIVAKSSTNLQRGAATS